MTARSTSWPRRRSSSSICCTNTPRSGSSGPGYICETRWMRKALGAHGAVEPHGLRDALERDVADELEVDIGHAGALLGLVAHQHLVGPRVVRDPGRDIHRPSEVVAFLDDDRSGVDAHPGRHRRGPLGLLD